MVVKVLFMLFCFWCHILVLGVGCLLSVVEVSVAGVSGVKLNSKYLILHSKKQTIHPRSRHQKQSKHT